MFPGLYPIAQSDPDLCYVARSQQGLRTCHGRAKLHKRINSARGSPVPKANFK